MFTGLNAFNESDYNLTIPFNSTIGSLDYTNASRHFAEEPFSSYSKCFFPDILHLPKLFIFFDIDQYFFVTGKNNFTLILLIFAGIFIVCTCTGLVLAMIIYNR